MIGTTLHVPSIPFQMRPNGPYNASVQQQPISHREGGGVGVGSGDVGSGDVGGGGDGGESKSGEKAIIDHPAVSAVIDKNWAALNGAIAEAMHEVENDSEEEEESNDSVVEDSHQTTVDGDDDDDGAIRLNRSNSSLDKNYDRDSNNPNGLISHDLDGMRTTTYSKESNEINNSHGNDYLNVDNASLQDDHLVDSFPADTSLSVVLSSTYNESIADETSSP